MPSNANLPSANLPGADLPDATRPSASASARPPPALPPGLSLYLDAWRVGAALAVVLCHFGSQRMTGGLLWQATPYGAQAVDVFFVLSGYVIAYVADTRERDLPRFAASRAARIWSVAVPAAALTFGLDAWGRAIAPAVYANLPDHPERLAVLWQATAGLLFFDRVWSLAIPVGADVPWWSLGYEVPYYLAFAFAWFGGSRWRLAGPVLVALVAGPSISLLALLWIAGAAIWHVHRRQPPVGGWALAMALLPLPIWIGYETACHVFARPFGVVPGLRAEILQDLLVGSLFAVHLCAAPALLARAPTCPALLARAIRYGAARSFSIYLMHYPIMLFLRAALPGANPVCLLPATVACCLAVAELTERRTNFWRGLISGLGEGESFSGQLREPEDKLEGEKRLGEMSHPPQTRRHP